MLIQKSRLKWLNDGDSNSKFFHRFMKERRRRIHISSIITSSGLVNSVMEVKEVVKVHFEDNFKEGCFDRPSLDGIFINSLSREDGLSLEVSFLEEEIKETVWSYDGSKSTGPDGISLLFIKNCWFFLKEYVFLCFNAFFSGAVLSKSITSSFLILIPKNSNPIGLDEYHHICLMGCIYKIICKLLSSRIKKVLSPIISYCQSAFVPGVDK
ncbi:uncharacterized protein LOC131633496 [Vicia villosa]|uniref:uncharacterized protein LOC131633496 n=1 Tax=Vicia villosa TaxID=3911 RepID=UPI00273BA96C|nr:uncharacterized protein LOC131633496 [Vicia villosa]